LPLYHVGGLAIVFRCLAAGATVCFPDAGHTTAEAVHECSPTHLSLVPTQLYRWLEEKDFRLNGIRRVLIGGAALPESLRRKAETQGVPVATSYGMTETASQIAATPPGDTPIGSGKPLDHAQIRISEQGEILMKGDSMAIGQITESGLQSLTDEEGWFHTRDRGRIEKGILHVEGRMDNQFISGGENIQPETIEGALLEIHGIQEAIVVPKEDMEFGFRPRAWVDAEISEASVSRWNAYVREVLPGYMVPVEYRRLPEATGMKHRREELKP
jgi:O-succinylbenzoic acid--CoA ligase